MFLVRRFEQFRTVRRIQNFMNTVHCLVSLFLIRELRDNRPALRIEPHIGFGVFLRTDDNAVFSDAADKSVFIPALFERIAEFLLNVVDIFDIVCIVSGFCHISDNTHSII